MQGGKLMCHAPNGGRGVLALVDATVAASASGFTRPEMDAWTVAKRMADPSNGGDLVKARKYLADLGWGMHWVDVPREGNQDTTFIMRLDADLKQFILNSGGSAFIRSLVVAERARQEAGKRKGGQD